MYVVLRDSDIFWGAEGLSREKSGRERPACQGAVSREAGDGGGSAGRPSGSAEGARWVDSEDVSEPLVPGMTASFLVWDAVISGRRKTGGRALRVACDPVSPERCLWFLTHVCPVALPLAIWTDFSENKGSF